MIQVSGIDEIKKVLQQWPLEIQHKTMQVVNAEAARPLVDAAHFLAPVGKTGNLADSIGIEKPSISRVSEVGEIRVGPRRSGRYKGYHGHLNEFGTSKRTRRNVGSTGVMPKHKFMEPAFNKTNGQLFRNMDTILSKKMVSVMRRNIKSSGGTWSLV